MRQRANRLISHNAGMVENLLKFGGGGGAVFRGQIRLAPKIDGIKRKREVIVGVSQLIRRSHRQSSQRGPRISVLRARADRAMGRY